MRGNCVTTAKTTRVAKKLTEKVEVNIIEFYFIPKSKFLTRSILKSRMILVK